jgi:ketosteroid isomerase-like protein
MKRTLTVIAGSLLMIGCATSSPHDKNIAAAKKLFDEFNNHNWTEMSLVYAESASFLDPSFGKDYVHKTRSETAAKYADMEKLFPDIHDDVVGIYPSGDIVTVEFVSTGKMNDSISFRLPIVSVLTFKDGLIVKDATYYDQENP